MLITKDFLFEFIVHVNITLHVHLINIKMYEIFVKNDIDRIVKVFKKTRLDIFFELDYENVYNYENVFFVEQFLRKSFINNIN